MARLRDKASNKKVVLTGLSTDKNHLLRFLTQAKIHQDIMPTIYDKDGKDIVAVKGYIVSDAPEEIVVNIDIEMDTLDLFQNIRCVYPYLFDLVVNNTENLRILHILNLQQLLLMRYAHDN